MRPAVFVLLLATGCGGDAFSAANSTGGVAGAATGGTFAGGSGGSATGGTSAGGSGGSTTGGTSAGGSGGSGGTPAGGSGGSATGGTGATGGSSSCALLAEGTPFPTTPKLFDFATPDGALSASAWQGHLGAYGVQSETLKVNPGFAGDEEILTVQSFCPEQEAWVTIKKVDTTANSIGLQMKAQGTDNCEQLEIDYVPNGGYVHVVSCSAGQWVEHGQFMYKTISDGDRLGARVHAASGKVEVFWNETLLGFVVVAGWPHMPKPGKIGLAVWGGSSTAVFDDFGGGP